MKTVAIVEFKLYCLRDCTFEFKKCEYFHIKFKFYKLNIQESFHVDMHALHTQYILKNEGIKKQKLRAKPMFQLSRTPSVFSTI